MYVRLAFAVAAHLESEILIVDEVLAVGDAEFQKKCLGKMSEVSKGEGRTVLFVERVYDPGVINRTAKVSAKPAFIVDAYLSGGALGTFIFLFAYGAIAQLIAQKAETLFGGYILGTALIFSGLFQITWRGSSFEFIINTVFWSYITMLVIHKILILTNTLKQV
ncbi:MAG: hypothetical protein JWR38_2461 [Mucilaginibacter sp.]|nr:hypothetical protein [Mucilaginibacter sp.]